MPGKSWRRFFDGFAPKINVFPPKSGGGGGTAIDRRDEEFSRECKSIGYQWRPREKHRAGVIRTGYGEGISLLDRKR